MQISDTNRNHKLLFFFHNASEFLNPNNENKKIIINPYTVHSGFIPFYWFPFHLNGIVNKCYKVKLVELGFPSITIKKRRRNEKRWHLKPFAKIIICTCPVASIYIYYVYILRISKFNSIHFVMAVVFCMRPLNR